MKSFPLRTLIVLCMLLVGRAYFVPLKAHNKSGDEELVQAKLKLAEEHRTSDVKTAVRLALEALSAARQEGNMHLVGEANLQLGSYYNDLGGKVEAMEHLTEALEVFTNLNDPLKLGEVSQQLGNTYYYSQDFKMAGQFYGRAYNCAMQYNDTALIIASLIGRGAVYGNSEKMDSASHVLNQSYLLAKKTGDVASEIQSLFYLGDINLYSNRVRQALKIFENIEQHYNLKEDNPKILTGFYNSLTHAYIRLGNITKAREYSQKAYEAVQNTPKHILKVHYLNLKFRIDTLEGNYRAAVKSLLAYQIMNDSLNNSAFREKLSKAQTLYELARVEKEMNRLELDNKQKGIDIRHKQTINYVLLLTVILFLWIVLQTFRSIKSIRKKNFLLKEHQEELAATNEELLSTNEELYTQREELEAALAKLQKTQAQLIQSEKMASLGVLAAGVAHEINNPLNFIRGGAYGIGSYLKKNLMEHWDELEPLLEGIEEGVERAAIIVASLTQYSRQDNHPYQLADIHAILDSSLVMLQNQIKDRVEVIKRYAPSSIMVECRKGQLHQVFLNALGNASQAIGQKGTIEIQTLVYDQTCEIIIKDSGSGINKAHLQKVFDPFFTTKEPGQGSGLGLYISHNIIRDHGGQIEIESKKNEGTTLKITLPIL